MRVNFLKSVLECIIYDEMIQNYQDEPCCANGIVVFVILHPQFKSPEEYFRAIFYLDNDDIMLQLRAFLCSRL